MQRPTMRLSHSAPGRVFTMLNTQLPFTYVHLVSFM